jgi:uncharacterized protein
MEKRLTPPTASNDHGSDTVDVSKAWIQTYTGGVFHILDPRQNEIRPVDIGHSLAMQCRFTGHVRRFYSVAEHCTLGSYIVEPKFALEFLLHDASEAYIADINRPVKHYTQVGPAYAEVEARIMAAVRVKFDLLETEPLEVKDIDNRMLFAEKQQLLSPMEWTDKWGWMGEIIPAQVQVRCWPSEIAEVEFMHRFYELTGQL